MYYKLFIIFVSAIWSFIAFANNKLPPLDVYADNAEVSLMRISPNGERIAYRTYQNGGEILLIKEISTGKVLGGVSLNGLDTKGAYFIDDYQVILKTSKYQKINGYKGMHNIKLAFIYDLRTKDIRQLLIPGFGISLGQSSVSTIVGLSPDKKTAYMPAWYENKSRGGTGDNVYSLMKVRLDKKMTPRALLGGTHETRDFFVDENGDLLAREKFDAKKNKHSVESKIDGDWVEIFAETTPFRHRNFAGLTPDRKSLVVTMIDQSNRRQYYTMSLKDGALSEPLFTKENADVERVLTDLHRVVYGVQYSGFKPSYAFFDKKLTNKFKAVQNALPDTAFYLSDHTPDWKKIIFILEGGQQAGEYVLFANNSFDFLAISRPKVTADLVNPIAEYSYKARDGLTIPTLLTYPAGVNLNAKQKLPAVVMPHGGPESYDKVTYDWLTQYLASRGVVVIQPQFRGSKGFGLNHLIQGRGEWGKKIQDDITDAVTALGNSNIIDADKVCIMGWSYGGYAALAGAAFTPDTYKCAISINGISDVVEMLDYEERVFGENSETFSYWQEVINSKGLDEKFLKSISPINYVENVKIPVLLIHGQRDQVVEIDQSEDFYDALDDADKTAEFIELAGEAHGSWSNESRLKALTAIDKFLAKYLF